VSAPLFSQDGRRVSYVATLGDKRFVVADGEPGPKYDSLWAESLAFGPDGAVGYLATVGADLYRVKQFPSR
jgi:hypothetical protein